MEGIEAVLVICEQYLKAVYFCIHRSTEAVKQILVLGGWVSETMAWHGMTDPNSGGLGACPPGIF